MRRLTIRLTTCAKINDQRVEDVGFGSQQLNAKFVTCLQLPAQPASKAALVSFGVCFVEAAKLASAQNSKEGDVQNQIIYSDIILFSFMN